MDPRGAFVPAWQHEALELGKIGVEDVAVGLERVDLRLRGAELVVLALHGTERSAPTSNSSFCTRSSTTPDRVGQLTGERDPEQGVQLVDRTVGSDPGIELRGGYPSPTTFPAIPAARVDLRQPYGLVVFAGHESVD